MRRTHVGRIGSVLVLGLAGFAPAACASTIQPDGAAQAVVDLVSQKTKVKPTDVKCPDGVEAKVGETFDCTFTAPDGNYVAHMTIDKIEGKQVLFDIKTEIAK